MSQCENYYECDNPAACFISRHCQKAEPEKLYTQEEVDELLKLADWLSPITSERELQLSFLKSMFQDFDGTPRWQVLNSLIQFAGIGVKTREIQTDLLEAEELIKYFVDRVEAGTIHSNNTYAMYKNFIEKLNKKRNAVQSLTKDGDGGDKSHPH